MTKIFLAEDNASWLAAARRALAGIGEVTTVTHMSDAIDRLIGPLAAKDTHGYAVIVLDNTMQVQNAGIGILNALRKLGDTTPIIIHSANLTTMDERRVIELDGRYVRKNLDFKDLVEAVRSALTAA